MKQAMDIVILGASHSRQGDEKSECSRRDGMRRRSSGLYHTSDQQAP